MPQTKIKYQIDGRRQVEVFENSKDAETRAAILISKGYGVVIKYGAGEAFVPLRSGATNV